MEEAVRDAVFTFNTPLEMLVANPADPHVAIQLLSILHWRCDDEKRAIWAFPPDKILSILHWRCGNIYRWVIQLPAGVAFNTPLEMHEGWVGS